MVSLVLFAGLTLLKGSLSTAAYIGLAAGSAALGGYIDSKFIMPALFPTKRPDKQNPTFGELTITSASEGAPFPYCLGPNCKVPGIVTWMKDPWLVGAKEDGANSVGKGGGGSRPHVPPGARYYTHCLVAFNHAVSSERAITDLFKIKGNGRDVWVETHVIEEQGTDINVHLAGTSDDSYLWHDNPSSQSTYIGKFMIGIPLTISGFAAAGITGVDGVRTTKEHILFAGEQRLKIWGMWPSASWENTGDYNITLTQTISGFTFGLMSAIAGQATEPFKIYTGSWTQTPDSAEDFLDDIYGAKPPAYQGKAFISMHNLHLTEFSNQMPKFELTFSADDSMTYGAALQKICLDAGVGFINTTGVSGDLEGAMLYGPRPASQWLQPIMIASDSLIQENGGYIKFFSRANATSMPVVTADLGVHEESEDPPDETVINMTDDTKVPSEIIVEFYDIHNDLEKTAEPYPMQDHGTGWEEGDSIKYSLPISMCRNEAQSIARRMGTLTRGGRKWIKIQLPPKYMDILVNDKVAFTDSDGDTYQFLVQNRERGYNGLLILEGPSEHDSFAQFEWVDEGGGRGKGSGPPPPNVLWSAIIDVAPLDDEHYTRSGFYYCATSKNKYSAEAYAGAALHESLDDTLFQEAAFIDTPACMGLTDGVLGGSINPALWDTVNTLSLILHPSYELESVTDLECINGMNRFAIQTTAGWEIIGAVNCTLTDDNDGWKYYDCTRLLRGLLNTEDQIGNHADAKTIVYLNGPGIYFYPLNQRAHLVERHYKFVPARGLEADYSSVSLTPELGSLRPFGPCHIAVTRDASDDATFTWDYRTRAITRMFGVAKPKIDVPEEYEIDFYDGATVVRSVRNEDLTGTMEHEYTAEDQTTDGLTPGDPIKARFYQMSPIIGRGNYTEVTI